MHQEDAINKFDNSESKYSSKFLSVYNGISSIGTHEKVAVISARDADSGCIFTQMRKQPKN